VNHLRRLGLCVVHGCALGRRSQGVSMPFRNGGPLANDLDPREPRT
jgi:hypothetical protein